MEKQNQNNLKILTIENLRFQSNSKIILNDIHLAANSGEILGILGPSGAGKTTLFRVITGLINPYSGLIKLNDVFLNKVSVSKRPVSYLQQSFPLYNNLTVFENVMIAFEGSKNTKIETRRKEAEDLLLKLGLNKELWGRKPKNLSGGEAQRVALAKALLKPCKILLLDEPFSNIDKNSKRKFNQMIRNICKERNLITLYVSHAEDDLLLIADHIAFMENGRIIQTGRSDELLEKPDYGKVASIGSILGLQILNKSDLEEMNITKDILSLLPDKCEKIGWKPEISEIYKEKEQIKNKYGDKNFVLKGKVDRISKIGRRMYLGVDINVSSELQYFWHVEDSKKLKNFEIGENVFIKINMADLLFLDDEDKVVNGLL
jgi:ABC-type sugar transport system ATPase subunit